MSRDFEKIQHVLNLVSNLYWRVADDSDRQAEEEAAEAVCEICTAALVADKRGFLSLSAKETNELREMREAWSLVYRA